MSVTGIIFDDNLHDITKYVKKIDQILFDNEIQTKINTIYFSYSSMKVVVVLF